MLRPLLRAFLALSLVASFAARAEWSRFRLVSPVTESGPVVSSSAQQPAGWLVGEAADWMARLPDRRSLGALSIPGTHDSAARFGVFLCQNQSWTIDGQLDAGIRYLDIRLRRYGDGFAIHHSPCFQRLRFEDVLASTNAFLERHSRETIVMRAHEEYEPAPGSQPFAAIWSRYMRLSGQRFLPTMDHLPDLGEARGRVVVLRDAAFSGWGIVYGGPLMNIQDAWDVYDPPIDTPFPRDSVSAVQKFELIRKQMREASEHAGAGRTLYLNHLSSPGTSGPAEFAARANRVAFDFLASGAAPGPLGILAMDYPGEDLVAAIIRANPTRADARE